jgi:hypothetical protein
LGTNDLKPGTRDMHYYAAVRGFVMSVREIAPHVEILWSKVLPRYHEDTLMEAERKSYNDALELVQHYYREDPLRIIDVVDSEKAFLPLVDKPGYWRDHVHLSERGAQLLGDIFVGALTNSETHVQYSTETPTGWRHLDFGLVEEDYKEEATEKRVVTIVTPCQKAIPPSTAAKIRNPGMCAECPLEDCTIKLQGRTLQDHFGRRHLPSFMTYGRTDPKTMHNWGKLFSRFLAHWALPNVQALHDMVLRKGWFPVNRGADDMKPTCRDVAMITAFADYLGVERPSTFHETHPESPAMLINWRVLICIFAFGLSPRPARHTEF